jgi:hypothetical protein
MKTWSKTVLWVTLAVSAQGAMAELMRCGDMVIDDAQEVPVTQEQVLAACGQPSFRQPGQWIYERPGDLTRILEFSADGNLQSITEQPASE